MSACQHLQHKQQMVLTENCLILQQTNFKVYHRLGSFGVTLVAKFVQGAHHLQFQQVHRM